MNIVEQIHEKSQRLSEPLAREVLDFIEFLEQKHFTQDLEIDDLKRGQKAAMSHVWDNPEDEVWNAL